MLGEELSEQGYHASYVYCDAQMMEIYQGADGVVRGPEVPEKANEVVVSEYFLSTYGNNAKIGHCDLRYESFPASIMSLPHYGDSVNEKRSEYLRYHSSNAALTGWKGLTRLLSRYVHFQKQRPVGRRTDDLLLQGDCGGISASYAQNEQQVFCLCFKL